ncbi:hypothetical protein ACA910_011210 [Epithemia clementina (nom. ined.)]
MVAVRLHPVVVFLLLQVLIPANTRIVVFAGSSSTSSSGTKTTETVAAIHKTRKRCRVHDHFGRPLSLQSPDQLPANVTYDAPTNSLVCAGRNSCREWTICNCNAVRCQNDHSCQDVHFIDSATTLCYSYAACQDARFLHAQRVTCGMQALNPCMHSNMQVGGSLFCVGPNSCVSDQDTQITVNVGADGLVKCADGGRFAYSCQHLTVEINHTRRACIAPSIATAGHCAVVCEGDMECKLETIRFWVLPS